LLALIGLLGLCIYSGANTFSIPELTEYFSRPDQQIAAGIQSWLFPLLLFGFGILVSLWPFHSWAPMGYASAPTATAMMHAGVLKKFGLYALIRVAVPMLPVGAQDWMPILAWLCLGNLLYCGWVAMRQKDLNWLVGYSSVAHMGFIFLGIASLNVIGITGAVLVMVAHGFLAALTFALNGYIYRQTGTLEMAQLGGLLRRMPFIGVLLLMAAFAGCGLPGFANFAGEVTVFFGAWSVYPVVTVIACWGALVIGAIYFLRAVRNVLHGPAERWAQVVDANWWRKVPFALLLTFLLLFGFYPRLLTRHIEVGAAKVLESVQPAVGQAAPGISNTEITFKN
jgi:NADH-quinone oxidoreductase subunit M